MLLRHSPACAAAAESSPSISYVRRGDRSASARLVGTVERLTGRKKLEAIYRELKRERYDPTRFFSRALHLAGITYGLEGQAQEHIAESGPLILIANHPFGVVDGLILCDIASRISSDFRILIHALLCRDEDLARHFLPIDFSGSRHATAINIASKREALRTLAEGGVLLVFPAGGISTRRGAGFGTLADFPWSTFTAKLVARSGARVVPLFFHGSNSLLFHVASALSPTLRASLLLNEARNKFGRHFDVTVGATLEPAELDAMDRRSLTNHLQTVTWNLARR